MIRRFETKDLIAVISVGVAVISVGVAIVSLILAAKAQRRSGSIADRQQTLESQIAERESAPLLVPGVEPGLRLGRRRIQLVGSRKQVVKYTNFLLIHWTPGAEPFIVVPVRNVGEAVAIVLDEPARVVPECTHTPREERLSRSGVERLGFYVVRPGESEQLGYSPRGPNAARIEEQYKEAFRALKVSILIRYTDQLGRKIRWTCITYTRGSLHQLRWSVAKPVYGERINPNADKLVVGSG